jgi:hypothetical protein
VTFFRLALGVALPDRIISRRSLYEKIGFIALRKKSIVAAFAQTIRRCINSAKSIMNESSLLERISAGLAEANAGVISHWTVDNLIGDLDDLWHPLPPGVYPRKATVSCLLHVAGAIFRPAQAKTTSTKTAAAMVYRHEL